MPGGGKPRVSRRKMLASVGMSLVLGTSTAGARSVSGGAYQNTDVLDVFVGAGQSNAVGKGDARDSPTPPTGTAFEYTGRGLVPLADPVGGHFEDTVRADTGSLWPAFADRYYRQTGRHTAFVVVAKGGTACAAAADVGNGNWSSSGTLRSTTVTAATETLAYLEANDYSFNLGGVVWHQGTKDARGIDAGRLDKTTFESALEDLISYFRSELGSTLPFHIIQTGVPNNGDTGGFQSVRDAQAEVAHDDDRTHLVSTAASTFASRGLMADDVHYTQTAYTELGRDAANTAIDRLLAE